MFVETADWRMHDERTSRLAGAGAQELHTIGGMFFDSREALEYDTR